MFSTHKKGEIAQLQVQLRATEMGIVVSRPTTEARYDMILDTDAGLERAQVKYADRWNGDAISIDLRRDTRNSGIKKTYDRREIDVVYVYVPEKEVVLRLTPELFHQRKSINIRFSPAKNNQKARTLMSEDFIW